ncbi:hypothetical protein Acy02nite_76840 [Actinoplanes cyaneus]|uniref:Uncharacterized protein n=1 Tax=Actinoplanes cyaneus TaxID=52696 RepID=A0A919M9U1_9ACTN|nr:hypothetical protein Acy02nite_76840 [Actinoplanes cyaneus]
MRGRPQGQAAARRFLIVQGEGVHRRPAKGLAVFAARGKVWPTRLEDFQRLLKAERRTARQMHK